MKKMAILTTLLFSTVLFAEDLIIDGETVYLAGDQYYDNIIITNGGVLALVEYGGSQEGGFGPRSVHTCRTEGARA